MSSDIDTGIIYQGDNLKLLRQLPDACLDLIYIDPPFYTQRMQEGARAGFSDVWESFDVFINFIMVRVKEMRRVLKSTGSIFIHLDWRTVHYVKVEMDKVFGYENFVNEIIWAYRAGGVGRRSLQKKHDTILFYGNSSDYKFNLIREKSYCSSVSKPGMRSFSHDGEKHEFFKDAKGCYRWSYLKDFWQINRAIQNKDNYLSYPNQKPMQLLELILKIASDPGDVVADFFCGSGTTLDAAAKLGRQWIGCDKSPDAVKIAQKRLMLKYPGVKVGEVGDI